VIGEDDDQPLGAMPRYQVMLAVQKVCDENDWPYPLDLVKWIEGQK
jgi:hypothetical protein